MKIVALEIIGFGQWQNFSLSFDSKLELVYGENEAGKTTMYQFIRTMFFGFPVKKGKWVDYEPKNGGPYGGRLIFQKEPYGEVTIERLKNKNNGKARVLFSDGQIGDEQALQEIVQPLTKDLFDEVFSFQQAQLQSIEQLDEQQLQNLLLAIGLTGSQRLMKLETTFEQEQQKIFKPSGRKPILNQKIKEYQLLQQQIGEKEATEQQYQRYQKAVGQIRKEQAINRQKEGYLKQQGEVFKKQLELWPLYQEQQAINNQLKITKEHSATEEQLKNLAESYQKFEFLKSEKQRLTKERSDYENNSLESPALLFYLGHEAQIQQVLQNQIAHEKYVIQKTGIQQSLLEKKAEQERLSLQHSWSIQGAEMFPEKLMAEIEQLNATARTLEQNEQTLKGQLDYYVAQEAEMERELNWLEGKTSESATVTQGKNNKRVGLGLAVLGGILGIVTIISKPSFFVVGVTLSGLLVICGLLLYKLLPVRGATDTQMKERWQGKLSQLDQLREQLSQLEQQLKDNKQQDEHLQEKLKGIAQRYQLDLEKSPQEWLYALPDRARFVQMNQEIKKQEVQLEDLTEQLKKLQKERSFLAEWLPIAGADQSEVYGIIRQFASEMIEKKQGISQMGNGSLKWLADLKQIEARQKELNSGVTEILQVSNLSRIEEIPGFLAKQNNFEKSQERLQMIRLSLQEVFQENESYDLTEIEQNSQAVRQQQQQLNTTFEGYLKEEQKYHYELQVMEKDGLLDTLYQEEANQLGVIQALLEEWTDYRLAEALLKDLLQFLSEQQLPALLATATAYFKIITGTQYQKCQLVAGQLSVLHKSGQRYLVNELSTGTRDQLYISLRLAFIQLHSQDCPSPVIIDDGWLHYDRIRKTALFELLEKFSQQVQVICLSSDYEIKAYFEQRNLAVTVLTRGK